MCKYIVRIRIQLKTNSVLGVLGVNVVLQQKVELGFWLIDCLPNCLLLCFTHHHERLSVYTQECSSAHLQGCLFLSPFSKGLFPGGP